MEFAFHKQSDYTFLGGILKRGPKVPRPSDGHDFFGFVSDDGVDLLIGVLDFLLNLILDPFLVVIGEAVVFFDEVQDVAPDVPDRDLGFLTQPFGFLGDVFPDILG